EQMDHGGRPALVWKARRAGELKGAGGAGQMIMSDSWVVGPGDGKTPPLGRVGCTRRLTRHDWNGGNNNLAEEMLGYVHGLKTISVVRAKSRWRWLNSGQCAAYL